MKTIKHLAITVGAVAIVGFAANASAATASSSAGADIVPAIAISNDTALHFGDVIAGGTSGTVVMSTAGSRSATGGASLGNAGSASASAFTVTGDSGGTYAVTLPSSVTISAGAETMTVDTFTSNETGTLTGGTESFDVGATLHVGAGQASGSYSGSFDVTVAYN